MHHSWTHGAVMQADGMTRFSLWAPDATDVELELGDGERHSLQAQADGWFVMLLPCPAGTAYRYWIDRQLPVADPASRAQLEDVEGWSLVVDPQAYRWKNADWQGRPWHESVLYEVHAGLLGGYAGVEAHLPQLQQLGVTAIELMPIGEFPGQRNWGYDGVLPFAPESTYGTPEQLKQLIDTAHGLGLMVFIDVVYNHFGPQGNYLHQYASAFFRDDVQTPWGAAIDFRRRQVRDFFCENALMWLLEYRVDGLRLDAVHAILDKEFLVELANRARVAVGVERQIHLVLENEDNQVRLLEQGFTAQWNDDGHNVLHSLLTDEREGYYADFCEERTAKLARVLSEGFVFQGEADRRGRARGEPSWKLPPYAFVLFLQNHDQVGNRAFGERLVTLADHNALKVAVALMLLSPMIPLLFMGEEWGSTQPFLFFTDYHDELGRAVREGRQSEFAEFTAFAGTDGQLLIPDPNALSTFTRSAPELTSSQPEHHLWWAFYRDLLDLRHRHIVPRLRGTRPAHVEILAEQAVSAVWRMGDDVRLRIDLNFSDTEVATGPLSERAQLLFGLRIDAEQPGTFPPHSLLATLEPMP
jgi:maltooligosyltrehalose trehalohydrolase